MPCDGKAAVMPGLVAADALLLGLLLLRIACLLLRVFPLPELRAAAGSTSVAAKHWIDRLQGPALIENDLIIEQPKTIEHRPSVVEVGQQVLGQRNAASFRTGSLRSSVAWPFWIGKEAS